MTDELDEVFGLNSDPNKDQKEEPTKPNELAVIKKPTMTLVEREKVSRETIGKVIGEGLIALDRLNHIAETTESPRAYEVLATMIKTLADSTSGIMQLAKTEAEIELLRARTDDTRSKISMREAKKFGKAAPQRQTNIFVGTTKDLLKMSGKGIEDIPDAVVEELIDVNEENEEG